MNINPLEIIKSSVEDIQDLEMRKRFVALLNAQGHNNLYPQDKRSLAHLEYDEVCRRRNILAKALGVQQLSKIDAETSKLLAGARLNDNEDHWTVFFCENV